MTDIEKLKKLLLSAKLLQQNAEGCAVNHYGEDFSIHGMPGWLRDTKSDIEEASAVLNRGNCPFCGTAALHEHDPNCGLR